MRWTLLPASMAAAATSIAAPASPGKAPQFKPICRNSIVQQTAEPKAPAVKRLGELPPGSLILSVLREENGCTKPVVVRYEDGRAARR